MFSSGVTGVGVGGALGGVVLCDVVGVKCGL